MLFIRNETFYNTKCTRKFNRFMPILEMYKRILTFGLLIIRYFLIKKKKYILF